MSVGWGAGVVAAERGLVEEETPFVTLAGTAWCEDAHPERTPASDASSVRVAVARKRTLVKTPDGTTRLRASVWIESVAARSCGSVLEVVPDGDRPERVRCVTAARTGADRLDEMVTDTRLGASDGVDRPDEGLSHRRSGSFMIGDEAP